MSDTETRDAEMVAALTRELHLTLNVLDEESVEIERLRRVVEAVRALADEADRRGIESGPPLTVTAFRSILASVPSSGEADTPSAEAARASLSDETVAAFYGPSSGEAGARPALRERLVEAIGRLAYRQHFPDNPWTPWDDMPGWANDQMREAHDRLMVSYSSEAEPFADAVLAVLDAEATR